MPTPRPNPLQWLRYVYGGRLPDAYRDWVLYDATAKTWVLRFALRIVFEALPWLVAAFVLATLFTPLPTGAVLAGLVLSLGMSLFFTLTSADELAEVRLTKHGFPPGTGKEIRRRRTGSGSWP